METRIVIVGYKPKAGKATALHELIREHYSILKLENLVTNRTPIIMEANDGTIVEVFEWQSNSSVEKAHANPNVLKLWGKFEEVCEFTPIGKLEEMSKPFSGFKAFV